MTIPFEIIYAADRLAEQAAKLAAMPGAPPTLIQAAEAAQRGVEAFRAEQAAAPYQMIAAALDVARRRGLPASAVTSQGLRLDEVPEGAIDVVEHEPSGAWRVVAGTLDGVPFETYRSLALPAKPTILDVLLGVETGPAS